jgi:hypothetical protein
LAKVIGDKLYDSDLSDLFSRLRRWSPADEFEFAFKESVELTYDIWRQTNRPSDRVLKFLRLIKTDNNAYDSVDQCIGESAPSASACIAALRHQTPFDRHRAYARRRLLEHIKYGDAVWHR